MDDSAKYQLYKDESGEEKKKIGLAYIIVNEKFKGKMYGKRYGAKKDYKNMKKVFKPLGFKLYTYKDKSASEMEQILLTASQREDLQDYSCFVCVISSHGEEWTEAKIKDRTRTIEHVIIGTDEKPIGTQQIVDMFGGDKCQALIDKPKLFFLQACRQNAESEGLDHGVSVVVQQSLNKNRKKMKKSGHDAADAGPTYPVDEQLSEKMKSAHNEEGHYDDLSSGMDDDDLDLDDDYDTDTTDDDDDSEDVHRDKKKWNIEKLEDNEQHCEEQDASGMAEDEAKFRMNRDDIVVADIPCHDDMLVMFASPQGKIAWRDTVEGGWLLASLYKVFKYYIHHRNVDQKDLLSVLTVVARAVSSRETFSGKKMIPVIHHKLTKEIVFEIVKAPGFWSKLKRK